MEVREDKSRKSRYEIAEIPISQIMVEDQQVRDVQIDDDIIELGNSIASVDLLQFPGVLPVGENQYKLLWGRRRLEACKMQGWKTIPCRIYHGVEKEIKALALVENLHRRPMSISEEVEGVIYLHDVRLLSIDQITTQLGRSRTWVMVRLSLPNFPTDVRERVLAGEISLGAAEAIAGLEDASARATILQYAINSRLSISEVRHFVKQARETISNEEAVQAGVEVAREALSSPTPHYPCQICHTVRPIDSLEFIRVCLHGCPEKEESFHDSDR